MGQLGRRPQGAAAATPPSVTRPPARPLPPAAYPDLVSAAYLVDPVDLSRWSPESADNPSGGWAARCFNPKSELGVGGCIVCTVCHTKQLPSRRDTLLPAAARALRESGLAHVATDSRLLLVGVRERERRQQEEEAAEAE